MPVLQGSSLSDAVQRPLATVRSLFDQANQPLRDTGSDWGVEQYFKDLVSDPVKREQVGSTALTMNKIKNSTRCTTPAIWLQVPLLTPETVEQIPNHSLCRFRGMVKPVFASGVVVKACFGLSTALAHSNCRRFKI